ncbi:MAG: hypothetical protein OI74_12760 [Gammaproteobacteria bacterium (ex Lamellibrachia satsuma)]|nr:MAG: hypothetical protein OI74_12760 [Gammaproteobacteria bacterium (ex Lamellibrachia satsuma)]RRS34936.1 MAG: hypothetical protein NV67_11835 [Gammaproteobacteria bacterium (ex Lamellibrachia satsuma)]
MAKSLINSVLLLVFGVVGLFGTTVVMADEKSAHGSQQQATVVALSELMNVERLMEQIEDRQAVFVGETHDRYEHHLNQLAIIQGMYKKHPDMVIGLEFFQQPFQPVLDRYISGEIDENALLRESEYFDRWRYDYRLYRPIFRYAKEKGIPLIALNLEKEITGQASAGGIDSIEKTLKLRIPEEIDRSDTAYRQRLEAVFQMHPHPEKRNFDHFMDVQLLWDEGMAERAAVWFRENPQGHMVILAGGGHIAYGSGIPNRLKRRVPVTTAIVINASTASELEPAMGDFVMMTKPNRLHPTGKLGVFLDVEESPVKVSGFSPHSGAEKVGVRKGDRILQVGEHEITSYADVRIALMDSLPGEKVDVVVRRTWPVLGSANHTIEVELR